MKYLIHMWNNLVENFTCAMLVLETVFHIWNGTWSFRKGYTDDLLPVQTSMYPGTQVEQDFLELVEIGKYTSSSEVYFKLRVTEQTKLHAHRPGTLQNNKINVNTFKCKSRFGENTFKSRFVEKMQKKLFEWFQIKTQELLWQILVEISVNHTLRFCGDLLFNLSWVDSTEETLWARRSNHWATRTQTAK